MRHNRHHFVDDPAIVRRLIGENPWGILVSAHRDQLVASHYPVLLDEQCDELAVFTHVGRPDDKLHGFGEQEIMLIVQGVHGYISPSWYAPGATRAPTWNFAVAHCYGIPQILDGDTNLRSLARLVQHFERDVDEPMMLDLEWAGPVARGTVGIRLPISRFECKVKMSQDKDPETQRRVIRALRAPGSYHNPLLAEEMERALGVS
ncbi:MAG TPA: FMN-binding negative transcriptional regulator [Solirubrobacteraceae bacterium]|nr:FMN-binding negative transcriptional regulator [Solirubrobacteraceae bacterium]